MKREQFFKMAIISLSSIILLIIIYKGITASLKINQGKYRVADIVVTSTADVISRTEENGYLSFDASQKNQISFLLSSTDKSKAKSINVKNIVVNDNAKNAYISQKDREEVPVSNITALPIDISYREDGSILLELDITNKNIVQNQKLPDNVKELKYDGRAFADIGKKITDLEFELSFDVEILGEDNVLNTMKAEFILPNELLITKGFYAERLKTADFVFKTN